MAGKQMTVPDSSRFGDVGRFGLGAATLGLSLLRKRGKTGAGVALLGSAAALSLLKRCD